MKTKDIREHIVEHVDGLIRDKHTHGSWLLMTCPRCEEEGKGRGKLNVNIADGWFFCFRCGVKGPVPELKQSSDALYALFANEEESPAKRAPGLPPDFRPFFDPSTGREVPGPDYHAAALRYLQQRGIDREIARQAMLGSAVCGPRGSEEPRLVVPAFGWDNWCAGYSARVLPKDTDPSRIEAVEQKDRVSAGGSSTSVPSSGYAYHYPKSFAPPKYYKPPGFDRNELYMAEDLKTNTVHPIYVVEGVFDALPLLGDAVAVWGQPTDEQIALIAQHAATRDVVFAGDRDTGNKNMLHAAKCARAGKTAMWIDWKKIDERFSDIGDLGVHGGSVVYEVLRQATRTL